MFKRLTHYFNAFGDGRYEDLVRGQVVLNVIRDLTAGLIVALIAIPLSMGFAMASGLRPEQGILGGVIAGLAGALFGGSKYQVYGATAAYIPLIAAITSTHGQAFLIVASLIAGGLLVVLGLFRLGRFVNLVPHSIVVGFTIGIAVTIGLSQAGEFFGFTEPLPYAFDEKIGGIRRQFGTLNIWALVFALGTVLVIRTLLKISVFIPGPLVALGLGTFLASTALDDVGLSQVKSKYGSIPTRSWVFTPPDFAKMTPELYGDLAYYALAIFFVAAIESLLCSRMADRLANNKGVPFDPDKELFGQGLVNVFVVLFNGFPHTGALARTATNIKLGASSPLASISMAGFTMLLAFYLAHYLELVPMACIGGILVFVAMNMVKKSEIDEVVHHGRGHVALMVYTAVAVIATDFLTGVLTALAIYGVWQLAVAARRPAEETGPSQEGRASLPTHRAMARRPQHDPHLPDTAAWLKHIRHQGASAPTVFVSPQASVIGRVVLGDHVHVAAGTSIRADEGSPFFIGPSSNVQDGVIIHALKDKKIRVGAEDWAVYVGRNVSMAHGAIVHGPCYIGDDTFIGFKATVHDSIVGSRCFIGIGAVVVGVEIPDGKHVPHGAIVDSADKVARLGDASAQHAHFNEEVVEVNRGLAAAYREHQEPGGRPALLPAWTSPGFGDGSDRF